MTARRLERNVTFHSFYGRNVTLLSNQGASR
jgi:hypothetical protein